MSNDLTFRKMHGLGNDFVIIDGRHLTARAAGLGPDQTRAIAERRTGLGCDQVIVMEKPEAANGSADVFMRILNNDGSEAQACGNATRCVADLVMNELGRDHVTVQTVAGLLKAERLADGRIAVDMGTPRLEWQQIPLAEEVDTNRLPLAIGALQHGVAVNVGNPHAVHFVDDVAAVPLEKLGPVLETDPLFPEKANIEAAQVLDRSTIRMRVWERGVGITQACGSAACATLVAAVRRGLTGRKAELVLDGGSLDLEWREDGHIVMTGPVAYVAEGTLSPSLLGKPERAGTGAGAVKLAASA
jgi:diaminopimelate epimerase